MVNFGVHHLSAPVAHQRRKLGGRSHHFLPLQARRTGRGGDTPAAAPLRLAQPARGIRANPRPMRVSGHSLDHNGEGSAL